MGKRGRKTNSANDGSDSDEAYFEDDGGDDDDESEDGFDSEDEYDEDSDEEYGDGDYDDGEEYGRNRIHRPSNQRSGYISQPQLPPILAALTDKMILPKPMEGSSFNANSKDSSGSLTAAQFQEMARNAVSSLAASSSVTSGSKPSPILLPRTPQVTDNIRENVSQELKQSISNMLLNPELRAALIAKLQANKVAAANIAPKPQYSPNFINYNGPQVSRQQPETISSSRARRATKSVDYSNYFKDDVFEEYVNTSNLESPKPKATHSAISSTSGTPGNKRGRPTKHHNPAREASHGQEIKKKARPVTMLGSIP